MISRWLIRDDGFREIIRVVGPNWDLPLGCGAGGEVKPWTAFRRGEK